MNTTFFMICGIAFLLVGVVYVSAVLTQPRSRKIDPFELRHYK